MHPTHMMASAIPIQLISSHIISFLISAFQPSFLSLNYIHTNQIHILHFILFSLSLILHSLIPILLFLFSSFHPCFVHVFVFHPWFNFRGYPLYIIPFFPSFLLSFLPSSHSFFPSLPSFLPSFLCSLFPSITSSFLSVIWENVAIPKSQVTMRTYITNFGLIIGTYNICLPVL